MDHRLKISLLSRVDLTWNGQPIPGLTTRKAQALLIYLACTGQSQAREVLAELLWPERPQTQALHNLRTELARLRQTLPAYIISTRHTLAFNQAEPYWLDVAELERPLVATRHPAKLTEIDAAALTQALDLYQGDFLAGFHLSDAPDFEAWASLERERLHRLTLEGLHQMVGYQLDTAHYKTGIVWAQRLLALDEFDEAAHSQLLCLLALNGQQGAALAHYDHYKRALAAELGVEPDQEISALYEQIRAGEVRSERQSPIRNPQSAIRNPPLPPCPYRGLAAFSEADAPFFFGRETFTAHLLKTVYRQPLVAIIGPSGSGKSSVVLAGLLPHLRQEFPPSLTQPSPTESGYWRIVIFRPGSHPIQALAAALLPLLEPHLSKTAQLIEITKLQEALYQGRLSLAEVAARIVEQEPKANRLLLVADQFEELYTLCPEPDLQRSFVDMLLETTADPSAALRTGPSAALRTGPSAALRTGHRPPTTDHRPPTAESFQSPNLPISHAKRPSLPTLQSSNLPTSQSPNLPISQSPNLPISHAKRPLHLILTLRADFMGQALTYRPLADALQGASLMLGPLNRAELKRVIEEPARKQKVAFETGLVERILADVGHKPGSLPLLEFALTNLWERQSTSGGPLTHASYEAINQVSGALTHYADRVYSSFNQAEQAGVRRALLQMVQPGLGTEDTRRVAQRAEISETDWSVAQQLAAARLAVTDQVSGQETIELAHETLIREWGRLRDWLNEDRAFRTWQERLRVALRQWAATGQDEGVLLRGALLAEAEGWWQSHHTQLGEAERAFITASLAFRDRRQQEAEAQRQRELAQVQALAEAEYQRAEGQAKASRRLRWLAVALSLVFMGAVGAAIFAFNQQQEAEQQTRLATAGQLATQAEAVLDTHPQRSLLLALEALNATMPEDESRLPAAEQALRQALAQIGGRDLSGHKQPILAVAISSDNRWLVTGSEDQTARLWDLTALTAAPLVLSGHEGAINAVAISPDNHWLVTASEDQTTRLWDLTALTAAPVVLSGHEGAINALAISLDNRWLVTGSEDQTARLWDLDDPTAPPIVLAGHKGALKAVAISPDNRWLVTGSNDGTARRWDLTNPTRPPLVLRGHTSGLSTVAISPNSRWLVTASASGGDNRARLWNLADPSARPRVLSGHAKRSGILAVTFSPNNRWLVTAGDWPDNTARVWDLTDPMTPPVILTGHQSGVKAVAISPDNRWLATASFQNGDNTARLWDLTNLTAAPLILRGHDDYLNAVIFSPDSRRLVSASMDATVRLWDLPDPTRSPEPLILRGHEESILALTFSPDNHWLVSSSGDSTIRLWNLSDPTVLPIVLRGHEQQVNAVAVSRDNHWLVSGGQDSTVRVWDLSNLSHPPTVLTTAEQKPIWAVALSVDNHWLAAGSTDQTVHLWNLQALTTPPTVLTGHKNIILAVAFSPDNRWLVSGTQGVDGTARLWDLTDLRAAPLVLAGSQKEISSVAISPDSRWLATGSWDTTARLWDLTDLRAAPLVLSGHQAGLSGVAFSPDQHWLATVSGDKTARLWDMTDLSAPPVILSGHEAVLSAVAFSPDSQWLATGSWDKTVRLWNLNLAEVMALACRTVNRNLSDKEWEQYFRGQVYRPTCPNLSG